MQTQKAFMDIFRLNSVNLENKKTSSLILNFYLKSTGFRETVHKITPKGPHLIKNHPLFRISSLKNVKNWLNLHFDVSVLFLDFNQKFHFLID